jgi:1,2-dihydroxy-3-keto-5-methylthiopentene dioxygenase
MTRLIVTPEDTPNDVLVDTEKPSEIAAALDAVGVHYEQWPVAALAANASDDDILAAFAGDIRRVSDDGGYVTVDVARLRRGDESDEEWAAKAAGAREKFLAEHTHADDEVRFFVDGRGAFYLRLGGRVHTVLCETGDMLSVPAGTRHWFDMGTSPQFTALRFFREPEGWVGAFTGDTIATSFPTFDALTAA